MYIHTFYIFFFSKKTEQPNALKNNCNSNFQIKTKEADTIYERAAPVINHSTLDNSIRYKDDLHISRYRLPTISRASNIDSCTTRFPVSGTTFIVTTTTFQGTWIGTATSSQHKSSVLFHLLTLRDLIKLRNCEG